MRFLAKFFTWWNGSTFGTDLAIRRHGTFVGEDEFGNSYYRAANVPPLGERRWVIYNGEADASTIPPRWHTWIHHRSDTPPSDDDPKPRAWQAPHKANQTGSPHAYRPDGSILTPQSRPAATGDYEAWSP